LAYPQPAGSPGLRACGAPPVTYTLGPIVRQSFLPLLLWLVVFCAQAEFAPGMVSHVATNDERTKGNSIRSAKLCKRLHGEWFQGKGYAYCVLQYADAGKMCKSSKDCIGHCIAPVTDKPVDRGACQIDDSTDDCGRPHYEDGNVIYVNCD
jgi:hypothetical protein